ncbi:MAG: MalM family protein [Pseudomonadota bacterium]
MRHSLVLLLSGLSLIGCSSNNSLELSQNTSPITAEVCCQSSQDFPWVFLNQNQTLKFNIDNSSPAAQFDTGKSFFVPMAFDQQSGNVDIVLRSIMLDSQVAIPSVQLLNERFEVVRTFGREDFEVLFSDALARNRFELKTEVNTVDTPYIVVYSDNSQLGDKVVVPHPAKVRAEESGEPLPIVTDPTYLSSTQGSFTFEVETLTLSGYGQKNVIAESREKQVATSSEPIQTPVERTPSVVQPETQTYYHTAIKSAVEVGMLDKALALLEEAKALNVEGAQQVFIDAVNNR